METDTYEKWAAKNIAENIVPLSFNLHSLNRYPEGRELVKIVVKLADMARKNFCHKSFEGIFQILEALIARTMVVQWKNTGFVLYKPEIFAFQIIRPRIKFRCFNGKCFEEQIGIKRLLFLFSYIFQKVTKIIWYNRTSSARPIISY